MGREDPTRKGGGRCKKKGGERLERGIREGKVRIRESARKAYISLYSFIRETCRCGFMVRQYVPLPKCKDIDKG